MAIEFKFHKERIVLNYQLFLFEEFVNIWKFDKSKTKSKANDMLRFVYLLCDIKESNPLRGTPTEKKEEESKYRAFKDKNKKFTEKEFNLLDKAIKMYIKLNTSAEERLLEVFDSKAEELADKLSKTLPETAENKTNGVVSFVSNSKLLADGLTKLSEVRKHRASIVASIKNEAISQRVYGQRALSPLDTNLLTPPS